MGNRDAGLAHSLVEPRPHLDCRFTPVASVNLSTPVGPPESGRYKIWFNPPRIQRVGESSQFENVKVSEVAIEWSFGSEYYKIDRITGQFTGSGHSYEYIGSCGPVHNAF
jgi:hypothetical protein